MTRTARFRFSLLPMVDLGQVGDAFRRAHPSSPQHRRASIAMVKGVSETHANAQAASGAHGDHSSSSTSIVAASWSRFLLAIAIVGTNERRANRS